MPSFDSARHRFRLAHSHLAVLGHLYDGEAVPDALKPARDQLQTNGLLDGTDAVPPELAELASALAEPLVLVHIEITGGDGITESGAVIGNDVCYVYEGWPGEEEFEYVRTDPGTLVWSLARAVGLHDRDVKPPAAPLITTTVGVMDAGFAALGDLGTESVAQAADRLSTVLRERGNLADPDLTVFTHLLLQLNANWRMTVAWANASGEGTDLRGITVLDCGPLGYWLRERPEEPILPGSVNAGSELKLRFIHVRELWDLITSLIPDVSEIQLAGNR